jgi:ATP-citrate lyase beta-subunit
MPREVVKMAQKAIRECDAKALLAAHLEMESGGKINYHGKAVQVTPQVGLDELAKDNAWLKTERLVVKPDELFGKRGKNGLLLVDADFDAAKGWILEKMGSEATVHRQFDPDGRPTDKGSKVKLTHFVVEPLTPHRPEQEYYLALTGQLDGDTLLFSTAGGIDVESNKERLVRIDLPIGTDIDVFDLATPLEGQLKNGELEPLVAFARACFKCYVQLHFGFLEINPLVVTDTAVVPLDLKARLDDTAGFICEEQWGSLEFPTAFGQTRTKEEAYIEELDEKSGASMKLSVLNPKGRVWTMVAGGGASVIYADTVVDLGYADELANYGEYSGDPTTGETREYARTILDLMTREKADGGKVLIIGGGIANFTDVAKTFDGIIQALSEYAPKIKENDIRIYVRRGGPNYREGLAHIKEAAKQLGLNIEIHGPEMHMTAVVRMALDTLAREAN